MGTDRLRATQRTRCCDEEDRVPAPESQASRLYSKAEGGRCKGCSSLALLAADNLRLKASNDKLQLENIRLQKENSLLSKAFKELETTGSPQTFCEISKLHAEVEALRQSLLEQAETDRKQGRLISSMTMRMDCLGKDLECSKQLLAEKSRLLAIYLSSNDELRQEMGRLTETALMGLEEIGSLRSELGYVRRLLKKVKDEKTRQNSEAKKVEAESNNPLKNFGRRTGFDYEIQIFNNVKAFR